MRPPSVSTIMAFMPQKWPSGAEVCRHPSAGGASITKENKNLSKECLLNQRGWVTPKFMFMPFCHKCNPISGTQKTPELLYKYVQDVA